MNISANKALATHIEELLEEVSPVKLGVNKKNELVRLIYEISKVRDSSPEEVLELVNIKGIIESGKGEFYHYLKKILLDCKYPSIKKGDNPHIMPVKFHKTDNECTNWDLTLDPKKIFIEKDIYNREWTKKMLGNFPGAEIEVIDKLGGALGSLYEKDHVSVYNKRRENLFLVENKAAFIKICPCTKGCVRCGYWILNIGFGCPVDCSYCYLQTYSNAPGMILPANIEDYYKHIEDFDKKAGKRIRIGTGEFTDSLAFDRYTGYSTYLIPFFKNMKNLVLELKTKVTDIDNILKVESNENVVISWSINPRNIAEAYEKGGGSIDDRIDACLKAIGKGYKVGFHFDPVVYYEGWGKDYRDIVEELFSHDVIKKNTLWISLGTLRYTPGLKQIAEQRFDDNMIYYQGEFFEDEDGKLRYPREIRTDMYNKMIKWIKGSNPSCWTYLCMEFEDVWKKTPLDREEYSG